MLVCEAGDRASRRGLLQRVQAEQNRRLAHARQYCHLYLDTNELNPTQVQDQTLSFLQQFRPE